MAYWAPRKQYQRWTIGADGWHLEEFDSLAEALLDGEPYGSDWTVTRRVAPEIADADDDREEHGDG